MFNFIWFAKLKLCFMFWVKRYFCFKLRTLKRLLYIQKVSKFIQSITRKNAEKSAEWAIFYLFFVSNSFFGWLCWSSESLLLSSMFSYDTFFKRLWIFEEFWFLNRPKGTSQTTYSLKRNILSLKVWNRLQASVLVQGTNVRI